MNSPSVDIAGLLEDSDGISLSVGTDLFVNQIPTEPNKCVVISDSGGYTPSLTMDRDEILDSPTIQILVRGNKFDYREAYALAEQIKRFLHGKSQLQVGTTRYILIMSETDILSLGYDDNNRPLLSCNFLINRTE